MSISYGGDYITDTDGGKLRPSSSVMRNRIINGAMVINQRGFSGAITDTGAITYTLDRWCAYGSQASKFTIAQSSTAPTGFNNSLLATSSSAYSITSTDVFFIQQRIEGFNTADLGWGTASAKTVTLSFQVYSSLTGTFGGAVTNSASNRSCPFSYSVPVANAWTTISVTIAGDTSGTWLTTNGIGIRLAFGLGVGSTYSGTAGSWAGSDLYSATGATSVVGTNGATFYITGVQLEVGSSQTGYEYRNYQQELAMCQRYYEQSSGQLQTGFCYSSTGFDFTYEYLVQKRANPTVGINSGTWTCFVNGAGHTMTSLGASAIGVKAFAINSTTSGVSGGQAGVAACSATPYLTVSAEL